MKPCRFCQAGPFEKEERIAHYHANHEQEYKKFVRNLKAKISRKLKDEAMRSIGLVKVRGALGGTYYE